MDALAIAPIVEWIAKNPRIACRGAEKKALLKAMKATGYFKAKSDVQINRILKDQLYALRGYIIQEKKDSKRKRGEQSGGSKAAKKAYNALHYDPEYQKTWRVENQPLTLEITPELVERILKDPKLVTDFGLAGMDAEAAKVELEMQKRLYRPLNFEITPEVVERILKRPMLVTDFGLEKMNAVSALAKMKKLQREHGGWSPPPEPTDGDFKAFERRISAEWREWSRQNTAEDVAAAWHSRRGKGNFVACERYFHFDLDISPKSFRCIALSVRRC